MARLTIASISYVILIAPVQISLALMKQLVLGLHPRGRQSQEWSLLQALLVRLSRSLLEILSRIKYIKPLSLVPGIEGDRFVLIQPAQSKQYLGPLQDQDVIPRAVGGTWTPRFPRRAQTTAPAELLVVVHFHGGAFIHGTGRDMGTRFTAKALIEHGGFSHVFAPQYRLSTTAKERFPAALQDAFSSYLYLVENVGVPADRIVISGDSAGGNLVLGLLRYLQEYGSDLKVPLPAAILLWSPWTDLTKAEDSEAARAVPNYWSDYLPENFLAWGAQAITDHGKIPASHSYISPGGGHAFKSEIPMWIHTGGKESLYEDNERFAKAMQEQGSDVEWVVDRICPHDIILLGDKLLFEKEAHMAARQARDFLKSRIK